MKRDPVADGFLHLYSPSTWAIGRYTDRDQQERYPGRREAPEVLYPCRVAINVEQDADGNLAAIVGTRGPEIMTSRRSH